MHRYRFLLYRPIQLLPVLFGISVVTFVLTHSIPGDPARLLLGARSSPEALANIRAQFGLDEPLWVQYLFFVRNLVEGRMGTSIVYRIDVLRLTANRIEPTLVLVLGSVLLALVIALPLATLAARNKGSVIDHAVRIVSTVGLGFPPFWLGLILIITFSVNFGITPVAGYGSGPFDKLQHMILPCLTIALALSAVLARNARATMINQIDSNVATAARARGLGEAAIFRRHVLPNSLIPMINLLAVNVGWLIGGTVVIESVFAIPGMGQLLVTSIFSRDYMVVQGVAMLFAIATVFVNVVADIVTVAVDPRVTM
jgi:peptide/nickel transport system permease protein